MTLRCTVALVPVTVLAISGCSATHPPSTLQQRSTPYPCPAAGYPFDRTLHGLVTMRSRLGALVLLRGLSARSGTRTSMRVVKDFASVPGVPSPHAVVLDGCALEDGVAPPTAIGASDVTVTLLVGGQLTVVDGKPGIDPWFIYSVDSQGVAHSLLESAGPDPYPSFPLRDLEQLPVAGVVHP